MSTAPQELALPDLQAAASEMAPAHAEMAHQLHHPAPELAPPPPLQTGQELQTAQELAATHELKHADAMAQEMQAPTVPHPTMEGPAGMPGVLAPAHPTGLVFTEQPAPTELLADGTAEMITHPNSMSALAELSAPAPTGSSGMDLGGDLQGGGSERPAVNRAAIITEVETGMAQALAEYTDEGLHQWLAQLQSDFYTASDAHHKAKDNLKQVDAERALARDAFRADQGCSDKHRTWKTKVSQLKESQEALRTAKEVYYRAQAAVEALTREIKRRTKREAPRSGDDAPRTSNAKRRKSNAPDESCPYCTHTYTVRDGLSTKTDEFGNRLHMRKCQCREKTPPCRNCPKCKDNKEIMALADIHMQFQMCQLRFKCEICGCRCPGAGKWVETDEASRKSYAERTHQRYEELTKMGWAIMQTTNLMQVEKKTKSPVGSQVKTSLPELSKNKVLRRLPADIRAQMEAMQTHGIPLPLPMPPAPPMEVMSMQQVSGDQGAGSMSADALLADPAAAVVAAATAHGAALPVVLPEGTPSVKQPLPPLPDEVNNLVQEVFAESCGMEGVAAVTTYLQCQRVTSLGDLYYLELPWLQDALGPQGLPPLLLNKFLQKAKGIKDGDGEGDVVLGVTTDPAM